MAKAENPHSVPLNFTIPFSDFSAETTTLFEDFITDEYLTITEEEKRKREEPIKFPHSFIIEPQGNPDSTTLAATEQGLRLIEPKGKIVRGSEKPVNREFILINGHKTSVSYVNSPHLEVLAFFTPESDRTNYVARNGHYVELGTMDLGGNKISAQYPLSGGGRLSLSVDSQTLGEFSVTDSIKPDSVETIKKACAALKTVRHTPSPVLLNEVAQIASSVVQVRIGDSGIQQPIGQPLLL